MCTRLALGLADSDLGLDLGISLCLAVYVFNSLLPRQSIRTGKLNV